MPHSLPGGSRFINVLNAWIAHTAVKAGERLLVTSVGVSFVIVMTKQNEEM
jgi:hypothetical protein